MSDTSLTDICLLIGELTGAVKALGDKIEGNEKRNMDAIAEANRSRANVHQRLDALVERTTQLEADTSSVKEKIEGMEKVTTQVTVMRTKAEGAGTLGRWLLALGGWVISAAVSIVGLYTWLTGKPPP
ncbi:DUF1515 family protein [Hoeflea sp.]|uniref:DUF1515 family protein n=1 Tax=Hoeflea sp. TaxID=1940281 RepID=UPI0019C4C91B|nr:DUF1515 family protein [Hoeflea sp.]MBC7280053.1 DUF1515 family protein [Hoeflea sp.]